MQINSSWLKTFKTTKGELLNNACLNVEVGAQILADNMKRINNPWEAVGAYNASCSRLKGEACTEARQKYAWKVYRALITLTADQRRKLKKLFF